MCVFIAFLRIYPVWLQAYLPTYLPTCLPACLSACLPACLPAYLPVVIDLAPSLLDECCFPSTETVGLRLGTGAQDGHLDFHTAPELCSSFLSWLYSQPPVFFLTDLAL